METKNKKELRRDQEDQNYLDAWKSGNIQNDLSFAEDDNY